MEPPATGQCIAPPVYRAGGRLDPPDDVWDEPLEGRLTGLGAGAGAGAAIPLPRAPGIVSVCPTTRFGSVRLFASVMSVEPTSYFAARVSSVSEAATVITTP